MFIKTGDVQQLHIIEEEIVAEDLRKKAEELAKKKEVKNIDFGEVKSEN
jgi:hypothetical protein